MWQISYPPANGASQDKFVWIKLNIGALSSMGQLGAAWVSQAPGRAPVTYPYSYVFQINSERHSCQENPSEKVIIDLAI